ncbi:MAG: DUF4349 domain-containing protein [Gemmatimonadaceae bacterium]|nr:DUF4349 domain-containing protein [Gemmatimonadaceae bacterium]
MSRFARSVSVVGIALAAASLASACGDDASVGEQIGRPAFAESNASPAVGGAMRSEALGGTTLVGVADSAVSEPAAPGAPTAGQPADPGAMVIRNGSASIRVDSLEVALAALRAMAARHGALVGNSSLSAGEYEVRSASVEIRVPAARFDSLINGLNPIGVVESVSQTAQDVGEEFVDISARVANARRLEERLLTLLQTRTGKLEDVLAVERELSRVREEIDRYDGRLRYLKTRVAMSTLTVSLHEKAPLVNPNPGENVLVLAFTKAWQLFVRVIAKGIELLGIIIPIGVLLALLLAWRARWRRRRQPPQ